MRTQLKKLEIRQRKQNVNFANEEFGAHATEEIMSIVRGAEHDDIGQDVINIA